MLNSYNYYSKEINKEYMSVSTFKSILECEAKYIAEQDGLYARPFSKALTVGNYIHSAFDSEQEHLKFIEENHENIFKKTKTPSKYAEFEQADKMIKTLREDDFCMELLEGEKEFIMTGELYGMKWKIRIDNLNLEKEFFSDIKTTKGLYDRYWSDRHNSYVSFVQNYNYIMQMYIYKEIIKQNTGVHCKPYIVAVTKENTPDKAVIYLDEGRYLLEEKFITEHAERVKSVWKREVDVKRCEKCDYCRKTKKLDRSKIIEVGQLLL